MERQMIRPTERPRTQLASERLQTRVLPVMAGEFVGPGEAPYTAFPGADVGFFT
jgi:hypothetical protein